VAVALLGSAALLQNALAQVAVRKIQPVPPTTTPPNDKPPGPGEFIGITLHTGDGRYKNKINAARDYIKDGNWETATEILQSLLQLREDVMVPKADDTDDAKEGSGMVSVKDEANRLLANLPPNGKEFYQLKFGPTATELLKRAKATNDVALLSQVVAHFLHTDAGFEATNLLASYNLDRGNYTSASLRFDRLLSNQSADRLPAMTLFRAAYAFHQAGDKDKENQVWKMLASRYRELTIGNETKTISELQDYVSKLARDGVEGSRSDWLMFAGGENRNQQGEGGPAFMVPTWKKKTINETLLETWLRHAEEWSKGKQPILPAFFPVAATITRGDKKVPLLVYRSYLGLHAVNVKTGEVEWASPSNWSVERMLQDSRNQKNQALTTWMQFYGGGQNLRPSIPFENSTIGALSTDNTLVYAVEDLAVPPPPNPNMNFNPGYNPYGAYSAIVNQAIQHSRLQAFDLATGKLKWELGGVSASNGGKEDRKKDKDNAVLDDSYFLGPPLPIGGKLYVLTEKQQELRLVCIDPAGNGKVVSVQPLATTRDKMQQDVGRRTQAAHLSYSEGVLVCPTNAGAVLGVDLLSNSLLWAYPYREKSDVADWNPGMGKGGLPGGPGVIIGPDGRPYNPGSMASQWKISAPIIVDGKVVFTAPDARAVHCINLRDGTRLWTQPRNENDLYVAGVFKGKVLIVGKESVRAVTLTKGEPAWSAPVKTGLPSGQGVASDDVYYLPLKEAAQTKEPEICAIDVERGQVIAHTKSRKKEVPGNLLFYEGDVLSQTVDAVEAFPQLKIRLAEIDEEISKDPNNPIGLTKRAELRLDKGDLAGAVSDLHVALKNNPDKPTRSRARAQLYDAMTEYFQRDFDKAEETGYLEEYEGLCKIDADDVPESERAGVREEERKRRANFLCLVAKGKESQGKLVDAFERYQEFGALAGKQELLSVIDEPSVKAAPDVWSQGRIAAMVAKATAEQREPLEKRIAAKWDKLKDTTDLDELRNFVSVFGSLFTVGREARLQLANRLMTDTDPASLLDAERHLSLLRNQKQDPELAARAVEALARLNTRKGLLEDAAYYYRVLGKDFATVTVRDGKTGSDLFNDLATDKRLLAYLDEPMRMGATGKIKVVQEAGNFPMQQQVYNYEHAGEPLPFFQKHRLALNFNFNKVSLFDKTTGEEKWGTNVKPTMAQQLAYGNGQPNAVKFKYQTLGHLVVMPIGHLVYGLDPVNKKVLWERNLHASLGSNSTQVPVFTGQLVVDPRDGTIQVAYQDGWVQRFGQVGTLEGAAICLQTRDALVAIDPVTGRTLWTRTDVTSRQHVFNDEQNVYVVDVGGDGQTAASTRVLRAYDGVTVHAPDFAQVYQKRVRTIGRTILLQETDAKKGTLALRLYDIVSGKDLWKQDFPASSTVLHSEDRNLAGVIEPDGSLKVIDLKARKEILGSKVDPKHLKDAQAVHLLSDGKYLFVAINGPVDANTMPWGGVQPNLMPGVGMRSLPVNGEVYAFEIATGKTKWHNTVTNQMIVLEHFQDMPMVLFTARYNKMMVIGGGGRNVQNVVAAASIEKRTGKWLYNNESLPQQQNFHALELNPKNGRIDLISWQFKLSHILNSEGAGKDGGTAPQQPQQPTPPLPGGGRIRGGLRPVGAAMPIEFTK
jgi:outer membrane protein assembly factor BamB